MVVLPMVIRTQEYKVLRIIDLRNQGEGQERGNGPAMADLNMLRVAAPVAHLRPVPDSHSRQLADRLPGDVSFLPFRPIDLVRRFADVANLPAPRHKPSAPLTGALAGLFLSLGSTEVVVSDGARLVAEFATLEMGWPLVFANIQHMIAVQAPLGVGIVALQRIFALDRRPGSTAGALGR